MLCPVCQMELKIAERQGVEIDYCAQCRGVWLDRGELDKIIDRSSAEQGRDSGIIGRSDPRVVDVDPRDRPVASPRDRLGDESPRRERRYDERRHDDDEDHRDPRRRKKKSFLSELFDFD